MNRKLNIPSEAELKDYFYKLGLRPLVLKQFDYMMVALCVTETEEKIFFIYKDEDRLNHTAGGGRGALLPISVTLCYWGLEGREKFSIAGIRFNDKSIFEKTSKIRLLFSNGQDISESIEHEEAVLIHIGNEDIWHINLNKIIAYDAKDNVIFTNDYMAKGDNV